MMAELPTTSSRSFTVTVNSVCDPPVISAIGAQTIDEDTLAAIPFTVSSVETAASNLLATATSSNPALISNGSIVFAGSGANRMVGLLPLTNQNGSATITVTVTDPGCGVSASTSFLLTVTPINDPPIISSVADFRINEDTPSSPIP